MQQNLAKWLGGPFLSGGGVLIGGGEESTPLINLLVDIFSALVGKCHLQSFNADRYFDLATVTDIISNASLFSDKNLIVISFKTKPTVEQQKKLLTVCELLDNNNFLLVCCDKLDKKDFAAKWVGWFSQNALLFNLSGDQQESSVWVKYCLNQSGLQIEAEALELLLDLNQNNLIQLKQELNRLQLLYIPPATIMVNEVKEYLLDNSSYNIYSLSAAYLRGDLTQTCKIFINICNASEDVILIMWNLAEDLRKLIKIKNHLKTDNDFRTIAGSLRIWGDGINHFRQASQRLSYSQLLVYLDNLAEVDFAVKGVIDKEAISLLEKLLIDFCLAR